MTIEEFLDSLNIDEPYVEEASGRPELHAGVRVFVANDGSAIAIHRHAVCYEVVAGDNVLTVNRKE